MEQVLEAQAAAVPVMVHSLTTTDVVAAPEAKQAPKLRLRWRFAAAFVLLLVFTPALAALLWTYLQHRY